MQDEVSNGTRSELGSAKGVALPMKRAGSPFATKWHTQLLILTKRTWLQIQRGGWRLDVLGVLQVRSFPLFLLQDVVAESVPVFL